MTDHMRLACGEQPHMNALHTITKKTEIAQKWTLPSQPEHNAKDGG